MDPELRRKLLAFFQNYSGKKAGDAVSAMRGYSGSDVRTAIRALEKAGLLWKRGERNGAVYVTSQDGLKVLDA
jgi:hypothetical protein